ncbi:hypothetical protein [uncultured Sulfitobacter sp.]|uniref:hypothetical protein n=1 Tax=uncultured Sulfitobacter sp. TaxID=191468 RepID=UPI0025975103|nr:hypothetical protein [uncultured Sulfitobacter sp.]
MTKARKAVNRAVKAIEKAYDALDDMAEYVGENEYQAFAKWKRDLREYGEHLEQAKWPDWDCYK